jgi:hypothetical protein
VAATSFQNRLAVLVSSPLLAVLASRLDADELSMFISTHGDRA